MLVSYREAIRSESESLSSHADIFKAKFSHVGRVVNISQDPQSRRLHQIANPTHIKGAKLIPLSHKNQRVGVATASYSSSAKVNFGKNFGGFSHRYWIVSTTLWRRASSRPLMISIAGASRMSSVSGLNAKTQNRHSLSLQFANQLLDLRHHRLALATINFNHSIDNQRVAAKLARD